MKILSKAEFVTKQYEDYLNDFPDYQLLRRFELEEAQAAPKVGRIVGESDDHLAERQAATDAHTCAQLRHRYGDHAGDAARNTFRRVAELRLARLRGTDHG